MIVPGPTAKIYLAASATDMRKSFDGLAGLVRSELGRDPTNGEVFVFINRKRNYIKLLHWETDGYVLYYKRLEKGTFTPPELSGDQTLVRWPDLVLMVEGITVQASRQTPRYHR